MTAATAPPHPLRDLPAAGPDPDLGEQAEVFGWLVGGWDVDVEFHADDGRRA